MQQRVTNNGTTARASIAVTKPTDANTVEEIKSYLDSHGISYPSNALKSDLLRLVGD
ncbi:HeH/LEM domain-containing protein [uncultured Lactobacillus sp.]|uniref:HeH/LEM domain-containing protein n=1 Tax=uncultured Lactobacillus sp. TaxID=153152 RepID=UPI00280643D9|nr:HeH/LEM domain-containing protein [uncultured Lactobacillus sp.]